MQGIKFLHCADVHIGASGGFVGAAAEKRRYETLLTFERILSLGREKNVDFILIAGDLFDSNRVQPELVDGVFRAVSGCGLPVIAVAGNHDPLSADSPFRRGDIPKNLFVFGGEDGSVSIPGIPARVFGRSFTGVYLEGESEFPLSPAADCYNILLLHGDTSGSGEYNPITPAFIEKCGMDYLALGHIHMRSTAEKRGKTVYAYPGCPEGQGFDETGEKGVYIGSIDESGCRLEFVSVCKRRYETVAADISGCAAPEQVFPYILELLRERFKESYPENLYKIILRGAVGSGFVINTAELSGRLSETVYFAKIKDETTVRADYAALARQNDLAGIFTRKLLSLAENAASDEERNKIAAALDIGLRAFHSEVKYREAD